MQNTEKGRKIATAAVNTSRAVAATSKAVGMRFNMLCLNELTLKCWWFCNWITGGALTNAKGAFSQWWSTFQQPNPAETSEAAEETVGPNGVRMSDIDLAE